MNESLSEMQDSLVRLHKKLRDQLDETNDSAEQDALVNEMAEVTHRVQLIGALLFTDEADELKAKVNTVTRATRKVNEAIKNINSTKEFLDTLSDFLGLVDDAIDLAKALAVA